MKSTRFLKSRAMRAVAAAMVLAVASVSLLALFTQPASGARMDDKAYGAVEQAALTKLQAAKSDVKARMEAYKELAATDHPKALKLLFGAIKPESEPKGLDALAQAIGSFTDPDCLKEIEPVLMKCNTPNQIYFACNVMTGLARSDTEATRGIIQRVMALKDKEAMWLKVAAFEAIHDGAPPNGELHKNLLELLSVTNKDWNTTHQVLPVTAIAAVRKTADMGDYLHTMEALVCVLENYTDDRVRYFAANALSKMAKMQELSDHPPFWRWWIDQKRKGEEANAEGGPKKGRSRTDTRPPEFVEMAAVGKRLVFCIDVSDSMKEEVAEKTKQRRKDQEEAKRVTGEEAARKNEQKKGKAPGPQAPEPLDWSRIKTKLDLAKADLVRSLKQLTEAYEFNVIVYSTNSRPMDDKITGFIKATPANKQRFINMVESLELETMTNIHGAMLDAYKVTAKGGVDPKVPVNRMAVTLGVDEQGLLYGADTIFFLTDGWGSWSDDSEADKRVPDPRRKDDKPAIGNGKYIVYEDIMDEFLRINKFRKAIVNTVGIGNHDKALMRDMAQKSGGEYVDLSD